MNRQLLIALVLVPTSARAVGMFVVPLPPARGGVTEGEAEVVTRAIEGALLKTVVGIDVVTPRALDTRIELDLVNACLGGDDAACVVDFAQAMGVHYVLRSQLARIGDTSLLTISLYDGRRAALLAQGQRQASSIEMLLADVPQLVREVVKAGDVSVLVETNQTMPVIVIAELAGGGVVLLGSLATHLVALLVIEPAYQRADLSRDHAGTWELARPLAFGVPLVGYLGGASLVGLGLYTLMGQNP